ncbi:hypothetical protein L1987_86685 [Smallanthus sonchifolius]|uniref:Uncharacterized protein n=1 Tax=Smallanthus sonchifolius TaxID=185202 RepID=A0ACB8Y016_9ASTR|nr:hypothetical protein L1987_86685 [Smallanthus sonchifolius]
MFLYKGTTKFWRTGSWTGHGWSGIPEMTANYLFNVTYTNNNDEVVLVYQLRNLSIFSRLVVNDIGTIDRTAWHEADHKWVPFWSAPQDRCDRYNHCGPFGICENPNTLGAFECNCLPGYEPQSQQDWYLRDGSKGCKRKVGTQICSVGDGFVELAHVKVPDTSTARVNMSLGLKACEEWCLRNCTCMGYASADLSKGEEGGGCITWHGDMIDMRTFSDGAQTFYVRVDAAELANFSSKRLNKSHKNRFVVFGTLMIAAGFLLCAFICCYIRKKKAKRNEGEAKLINSLKSLEGSLIEKDMGKNVDLDVFDLSTIAAATDSFSPSNKLGEGGFGSVYKGKLLNGQEVAVKRLSQSSGDEDEARTRRVVGTYGYMSPEYAMQGLFSVKSDVYSFGILVLEIISGRKNNSYYEESSVMSLIGHVWDLWKQDKALTIVDSSLGGSYNAREVLLCIHVGILCVQELASDRPTMTGVAFMLSNHETVLPSPNQPAFIFRQLNYGRDSTSASDKGGVGSVDNDTITILHGR